MKKILYSLALMMVLPSFASAVSLEEEAKVGAASHKYIMANMGPMPDNPIQRYVTAVGEKVLTSIHSPEFVYHFTVVADPTVNAFALPGGYVYITTGMLSYLDSEAALASVLGHEVGHVVGHHAYKQMEKSMGDTLLIFAGLAGSIATGQGGDASAAVLMAGSSISNVKRMGYSRDLETQADEFGMLYAYEAGYDPREASRMFQTLRFKERMGGVEYHGFMASHPDTVERIIRVDEKANIIANRGKAVEVEREEYLNAIRGLPWGKPDETKRFYDPPYRIDTYRVKKGDTWKSVATAKIGDAALAFELAVMNAMRPDDKLPADHLIKVPVPKADFKAKKEKE